MAVGSQDEDPSRLHVVIEGRVQGVGFRYAALRQAQALGLSGWVQNLPGGQVEALFEGPIHSLTQMQSWCEQGPPYAHVTGVMANWEHGPPSHSAFRIRG